MASPRSRLVTWSYTHLSFYGRRFWRPHPDLDRAATPALPPGGGRPLCGGRLPLLAAAAGCFAQAPQTASRGPSPRNPPRSTAGVGREGRPAFGATGVLLCGWAGSAAAVVLGFHRFSFTVSYGCRSRPSGDKWLVSHAGPLLAEPLMPNSGLWQRQSEARETADAPGTESAAPPGSGPVVAGTSASGRVAPGVPASGPVAPGVPASGSVAPRAPAREPVAPGGRPAVKSTPGRPPAGRWRPPAGFPVAGRRRPWPAARCRCRISATARRTGTRPGTRNC